MSTQSVGPLTWRVRLMFAVGQIPEGAQSTSFGFFLLFFYNQVLGLSGFLTSLAIVVALLVDAVSDPVIGSWSDGLRNRWGRRQPFMYAGAIPFAISFYLLFAPPAGLTEIQTFAWLIVFSVLTRTTQSVYSIPHSSLTAELSPDYQERTLLSSLRSLLQSVGTLMVFLIGFQVFFDGRQIDLFEGLGVVEITPIGVGFGGVLAKRFQVQLLGPPVLVGRGPGFHFGTLYAKGQGH